MRGLESLSREELIELVIALDAEVKRLRSLLEGGDGPDAPPPGVEAVRVPEWVKANRGPKLDGSGRVARKKRSENHARRVERATERVEHAVERCPDCGRKLEGGWGQRTRQVLDLPVGRYIVREHVMLGRRCGVCGKVSTAKPDLSGEVLGRHRVSIRVMSLVAYLATECRMPLGRIQALLEGLYSFHLSEGEIAKLVAEVAERGQEEYDRIREGIRSSAVVHADETGFRENGQNGYLWAFVTPEHRLMVRDASRGSAVPLGVLGEDYAGVVVADFYSGYSPLTCEKQRCWVHYLRDLKKLEETWPGNEDVSGWVGRIRAVYGKATEYRLAELARKVDEDAERRNPLSRVIRERAQARRKFEQALMKLAKPRLGNKDDPCRLLAQRIEKFLSELFVFVEHPEVPPENNAAERAIRPVVVIRKVSGGTRSPRGTRTRVILASLFGTWRARGLQTFQACLDLLASPTATAPTPA